MSAVDTPGIRECSSHFSFWHSRYSRVLKSFQLLVLQGLASTQSFQLCVLQVLTCTQVISAFGTPALREYSVISSHFSGWYSRYSRVLSHFRSCQRLILHNSRVQLYSVISAFGTQVPRVLKSFHRLILHNFASTAVLSHFSFWYSRYSRALSHFSFWHSRYSRVLSHFSG